MQSARMFVVLPAMMLMGQLDLTNPLNLLILRVSFGSMQAILLLFAAYLYYLIDTQNRQTKIKIPPAATSSWMPAPEPAPQAEEMTIRDYDHSELRKFVMQVVMGTVICSFIHYKWDIVQPLFIQAVMAPFTLYENPLFKINILGRTAETDPTVKRPFKAAEQNPFAGLFGQQEEQQQGQEEQQEDEAEAKDEKKQKALTKGPRKSKKERRGEGKAKSEVLALEDKKDN